MKLLKVLFAAAAINLLNTVSGDNELDSEEIPTHYTQENNNESDI